jgi:hypothetical protein
MDELVGKNYRIIAFRDLPASHQLAIAHYMAIDLIPAAYPYFPVAGMRRGIFCL